MSHTEAEAAIAEYARNRRLRLARDRQRRLRQENPEAVRAYHRQYQQQNRDRINARVRARYHQRKQEDPEWYARRSEYVRQWSRDHRRKKKEEPECPKEP